MIKAVEARAMYEANIQKDEKMIQQNFEKFLEEVCAPAILEAVESRKCFITVELPQEFVKYGWKVCNILLEYGYRVKGEDVKKSITIAW